MRHHRWLLIVLLAAGCGRANRAELTKEVLAADPGFTAVLTRHQEILNRVQTYQQELALKRATIERSIVQSRKELADASANVRAKTDDLKRRMDPDRQKLELALGMAIEKQRALMAQRSSLMRQATQLRKAISGSAENWPAAERSQKQTQLDEMQRDADRLSQELATLRQHVRLLRTKLLLIKL